VNSAWRRTVVGPLTPWSRHCIIVGDKIISTLFIAGNQSITTFVSVERLPYSETSLRLIWKDGYDNEADELRDTRHGG
jgi:hypothetical protein